METGRAPAEPILIMTKKNWLLTAALLVLATVYVIYFTDWFKPKTIHIFHVSRANTRMMRHQDGEQPDTIPVLFGLGYRYNLTEVKVYRLSEWETNHEALPLWHLISSSNSIPIKQFIYGQYIRGMKPAIPGMRPEPLEPDVTYHLILEAGHIKGEHDFTTKPAS